MPARLAFFGKCLSIGGDGANRAATQDEARPAPNAPCRVRSSGWPTHLSPLFLRTVFAHALFRRRGASGLIA